MSYEPVDVIRREAARFAHVLRDVPDAAVVPSCPGWTAADLLWHLTEVHLFWGAVVGSGATTDEQVEAIEHAKPVRPADRTAALALRSRATEGLLSALRSTFPDAPAWSWFESDQTVGFTLRMQTHEATIHRVDAELTAGLPVSTIADDIAVAGLDHVIDVMWAWVPGGVEAIPVGVVEFRPAGAEPRLVELYRWTGDAWGERYVNQIAARRADADARPARAVVAGEPGQLDLLVWGRPADVDRSGDVELLADFAELIAFGLP